MNVRVRFAPSPTGELHIGSVRTTLYNHFFAKQNGGTLVLRIEDTDQDRLVHGAVDSIYEGLRWFGIHWDEGPREGGPHAPYIQSERLAIYAEHARRLVEIGAAYPCFCTRERLDQMRRAQEAAHQPTRYDRRCRAIPPAEGAARAAGEPHVIRLKVPVEGRIAFEDLVHGPLEWDLATIDDQVLVKSDGFPTYHLAAIVDDHVMEISHVFRGEEWLPSTPKHLLVYRAFGWEVPPHAHFPNILGQDGRKLSKRHGATRVTEFRTGGYLPEALANYLSLIGWQPGTEEEIFSMDDLIRRWRIDQVQRAGGKWDEARLRWFGGLWIRRLDDDELAGRLDAFVPPEWDRAVVRAAVPHIKERMETLAQARDLIAFLFTDAMPEEPARYLPKKRGADETRAALARASEAIAAATPFEAAAIHAALEHAAAALGWKQGDVNMAVRLAVTGTNVGFGIYESVAMLGRDRALARIAHAEALLS